jgi:uncharacterized protein (TIGR03382 family)
VLQLCNDSDYLAHSTSYQPVETLCDGLDNDCNGKTDELASCGTDGGHPDARDAAVSDGGRPDASRDGGVLADGGRVGYDLGGCGCQTASRGVTAGMMALIAGMWLARRRRRAQDR